MVLVINCGFGAVHNHNQNLMDNTSLQLSFDLKKVPSPHVSIMEIDDDNILSINKHQLKELNESLDFWNVIRRQDRCDKQDCFNSKQLFASIPLQPEYSKTSEPSIRKSSYLKNDYEKNKSRIENKGAKALDIIMVESEEEEIDQELPVALPQTTNEEEQQPLRKSLEAQIRKFLPPNIEIPTEYLRGLINIHNQPQTKTVRRMKVERYLEKRRLKTWNKKICYSCRQKVAEQRLRIKGRFVARKKPLSFLKMQHSQVKIQEPDN